MFNTEVVELFSKYANSDYRINRIVGFVYTLQFTREVKLSG